MTFVCKEVLAVPLLVDLDCLHGKMKLLESPKGFNDGRDNCPKDNNIDNPKKRKQTTSPPPPPFKGTLNQL